MTQVAWSAPYLPAFLFRPELVVVVLVGLLICWIAVLFRIRRQSPRIASIPGSASNLDLPAEGAGAAVLDESFASLAAGFAHDINNLLTGILANAELLRQWPDDERRHEFVGEIVECAMAAKKLTRQISNQAVAQSPDKSRVDLNQLVTELLPALRARLRSSHQIRCRNSRSALWAPMDVTQVEQIISNLVINAADASPAGSVIEILLGRTRLGRVGQSPNMFGDRKKGGHFVYFEVVDCGKGMDRLSRGRLFQPFFTSKGAGHGCGLSVVLRCVNQHQGLVECSSNVGRGTAMRVLLPAWVECNETSDQRSVHAT